jgi:hypothetical protein
MTNCPTSRRRARSCPEGDRQPGFDVHVKKEGIDASGWAFFGFAGGTTAGQKLPSTAPCYACHAKEAAHDNVFTQFYPPLRERLAKARLRASRFSRAGCRSALS